MCIFGDFAKAYGSVWHKFFEAALRFLGMLPSISQVLVSSVGGGWVNFCVDQGYVEEVLTTLELEIKQGDLLSPPLFSLLTTFFIYQFKMRCPGVWLMLNADVLLV